MPYFEPFFQFAIPWPTVSPGEWLTLALLTFIISLSVVEVARPHAKATRAVKNRSLQTNAGLFLINSILLSALSASSLLILAEHHAGKGLLSKVPDPFWQAVIAFLTLDLLLYAWHFICHRFDAFWMFHRVHHSDELMNASTAFRVHLIELLLTQMLKALYVIVLGVDKMLLITEEALMTIFVMFHHANLSFPGENLLKQLIIVPALHRAHHSVLREEHDRNYGAVLSLWDRLFGTLTEVVPVAVGIKNNPSPALFNQILLGFTPVAGLSPELPSPIAAASPKVTVDVQAMIAEAAYYRAEKRGFAPGYDLADWLESEQEITDTLAAAANDCQYLPVRKRQADAELVMFPAAA